MSIKCMYCDKPSTHLVMLRSRGTVWALVTHIPAARSGVDVCEDHAAQADTLNFPGGQRHGGWVLDAVAPRKAAA